MGKKKSKKPNKSKPAVMAGFDYGCPSKIMFLTPPDYNDNLRASEIVGCAYGTDFSDECGANIPILSLMVKNIDKIKLAFDQFRSWINATGPDALRVEILYDEAGYCIALGPDVRHALWRTSGVGDNNDVVVMGLTYIKPIDSRHVYLENIAEYSASPVAPIYLGAVEYIGLDKPTRQTDGHSLRSIRDCPPILLLNLPVYKTKSEIPIHSGLVTRGGMPDRNELERAKNEHDEERMSPKSLMRERDRRLEAFMPITLHLLRTDEAWISKLEELKKSGFMTWQLEQAVINHRLWKSATKAGQYALKQSKTIPNRLADFLELDTPKINDLMSDGEAIIAQAKRDALFLLKEKGEKNLPADIKNIQERLAKLDLLQELQET